MYKSEIHCEPLQPRQHRKRRGMVITTGLAGLLVSQAALVQPAIAQESAIQIAQQNPQPPKRRTLFDMLFGKSREQQRQPLNQPVQRQQPRQPAAPIKKKPVISKPRATSAVPVLAPQPEAREIIAKNPDAQKILVIGDFMASSMADGLNEAFARMPDLEILNRANGSSGFVRQDYYNWNQELSAIVTQQKPAAIIMMIGANDRQPFTVNNQTLSPESAEWKAQYENRIDSFLQAAGKTGIPLIWLGQPPYKSASLSKTILSLNALYKQHAEQNTGTAETTTPKASFIDVWDGFVDDKGAFTQTGVDINGQTVRLRGNDGITMTSAGKRKLAFYAEKPLRKLLELSSSDSIAPGSTADVKSNEAMAMPVSKEITRIGPMKLSDLNRTNEDDLLGSTILSPNQSSASHSNNPAPYGRADDFHWPRP